MKSSLNPEKIISEGLFIKSLNKGSKKFHSKADLYIFEKRYYVIRVIGKQYKKANRKLTRLERDIHTYYLLLQRYLSLQLPKIFISTFDKKKGVILLMTEYFPMGDIVNIESTSIRIKKFKIIAVALIRLVTSSKNINKNSQLICSIDTNPENFFLDINNKIVYNDFTPPLFRTESGTWFEFRRNDEIHALKTEKEKRYFSGINLLINFLNKARIFLPYPEYIKFVKWICNTINKEKISSNNLYVFIEIFQALKSSPTFNICYKFKNYSTKRDLLRFCLSLNEKLTGEQLKRIYKQSKKINGLYYLEKIVNTANK